MKKIHFLGCGKLGKTLAKLLVINKIADIGGVVNRTLASSQAAIDFIGQGKAYAAVQDLPPADIIFITANDASILPLCEQLSQTGLIQSKPVIVHCCGGLSSDVLKSAADKGCPTASLHLIKSFTDPNTALSTFKNTYCAFEGDSRARAMLANLLHGIGANIFEINKENKMQYHAALVMANNYFVTLSHLALQQLMKAGVDEKTATTLVTHLSTDASRNIAASNHHAALTGPIQRGDIETVRAHLQALQHDPLAKEIYIGLGLATLSLTGLDRETKSNFTALFLGSR